MARMKPWTNGVPRKRGAAWRPQRAAAVFMMAALLVAAWAGLMFEESCAPTESLRNVEGVSEAALDAASLDARQGTDVQRAHLEPATFERVVVRHVVDGDTIAVERADGERVSVRLIGIDTPESVAPQEERNCEEGVLASEHMKSLVNAGDTLWLQFDTSGEDRYGRLLAYVWSEVPASAADADNPAVIARDMLNAIQVIDGYGQPKTYRPNTCHDGLFAQWGAEAAADNRGVTHKWA